MTEDFGQKVLKAQSDVAVPVLVVFLENIRHALEANAGLDEEVEAHNTLVPLVVGPEEDADETIAESISEGNKGIAELIQADVARVVGIESIEQGSPRSQERPQAAEFVETNRSASITIKHADHHAHGLRVEGCPVPIDKCGGEFLLRELTGA